MMAKQLRGARLDHALDELLKQWEHEPASSRRINVKAVADTLCVSRTSLYKTAHHSLDYPSELRARVVRIEEAARRQAENAARSPAGSSGKPLRDRLRKVEKERNEWKARCEELQLKIASMEYNANLYGWDASKLWRPLFAEQGVKRR